MTYTRSPMSSSRRSVGVEILKGLRQLRRGEYGRIVNVPSVSSVRGKTGLSQARFAELLGVSVRTLQEWEQGRRAPSGAARTLLLIAAKNPRALLDVALGSGGSGRAKRVAAALRCSRPAGTGV
jgi:putative transcriptional regulator